MKWLPREELLTYEELTRVARVCVERFGFESIRITGGEPTVRAHLPVLVRRLADLGDRSGHDDEWGHPGPPGGRPGPGRAAPDQHLVRLAASRTASRPSPVVTLSTPSWQGIDAAVDGRPRSRQGELRSGARCQRRRDPGLRRLRPRQGCRGQVHRVDATRRRRSVDVRPGRAGVGGGRDHRYRLAPGDPRRRQSEGSRSCRVVPVCRRARPGRGHRQCHPAVLRVVRPDPAHGRGATPQLPVLRPRDGSPFDHPQRWQRRRSGRRHGGRGGSQVGGALDRPGALHPARTQHEPDRRLDPAPVRATSPRH